MKTQIAKILILFIVNIGMYAQGADPHGNETSAITGIALNDETGNNENLLLSKAATTSSAKETPEYFHLRPEIEKAYGYSHAVRIGNSIKISGAVSMDDNGNPTAVGNLEQQMKNCYADIDKILKHYGCTFNNVIAENIFTTNMPKFLEVAAYRAEIYTNHFPTGSWLGVKELALPEFMIEIELEVHKGE